MNNEELFRLIERGHDDVGAALKLLEQAIAEERTEANRLVRRLIPLARDTWGEDRHALIEEAKEWLRRG